MSTFKVYKVGGAVRDYLLGIPNMDNDYVVVGANIDELVKLGYKPVGKDFPVFLHPQTHEEYALARSEKKTGVGYQGFTFYTNSDVTLEEDLHRRDITINAIAMDEDNNLIDPFNGVADIKNRIIRHVSNAFIEDPLRVLRVARFKAQLGFTIADTTLQLMQQICTNSTELGSLSKERIRLELDKTLNKADIIEFFKVLDSCNALNTILTEFKPLVSSPHLMRIVNQLNHLSQHHYHINSDSQLIIIYFFLIKDNEQICNNNNQLDSLVKDSYIYSRYHGQLKLLCSCYNLIINFNSLVNWGEWGQILNLVNRITLLEKKHQLDEFKQILAIVGKLDNTSNEISLFITTISKINSQLQQIDYLKLLNNILPNQIKQIVYNKKLEIIKFTLTNEE